MRTCLIIASLVCAGWIAAAESYDKCAVCQQPLNGSFYLMATPALAEKQPVCEACTKIETTCFGCGLPIRDGFLKMEDGRLLCERDARTAVLTQLEAQRVFEEIKRDLLRLFSGLGTSPNRNVTVHLVDGLEMQQLYKSQRSWHDSSLTVGLTQTRFIAEGELAHTIHVLKGMGPPRLMAVYAHEYAHAWLHENMGRDRQVEANTVEGFCEVVAYKLMAQRNQETEKKVILANAYTRGQINTLLKAEDDYAFHRLVDWMKTGVDTKIEVADTSRVLAIKAREAPTLVWQPQVTTPVPETLTLRGISGTPHRRFALINDSTLTKNEVAKVRIGNSNIVVRCLDISPDSVLLQVNGSPEKTELRLK